MLALAGALALITVLVRSMRRPLDDLVQATHSLAEGKLEQRVNPSGPRELQDLAGAFNADGRGPRTPLSIESRRNGGAWRSRSRASATP